VVTAGRLLVLALAALVLGGCSIDRIEWESAGFPVEEVAHALEEEHGAEDPDVECIQREVAGAVWECRARAEGQGYQCKVHAGPRERIHEIHCEEKDGLEPEPQEPEHEEQPEDDAHAAPA
jgi:hypothetical protein